MSTSPAIVHEAFAYYGAAMASTVLRLLALLALVAMPIDMANAPALAAPVDHHMMTGTGHCGEKPDGDKVPAQTKMDCTAACTALPASPAPLPLSALRPKPLRTAAVVTPFTGVVPEIATPPPRLS